MSHPTLAARSAPHRSSHAWAASTAEPRTGGGGCLSAAPQLCGRPSLGRTPAGRSENPRGSRWLDAREFHGPAVAPVYDRQHLQGRFVCRRAARPCRPLGVARRPRLCRHARRDRTGRRLLDAHQRRRPQNGRPEIHADAAATLFSTSYLHNTQPLPLFGIFVAVALVMLIAASSVRAVALLALAPVLLLGLAALDLGALYVYGQLLPLVMQLAVGIAVLMATSGPRLVSEQRRARAELALSRTRDLTTGLANRATLLSDMHDELHTRFSLMALGLDRFKDINESLGHAAGDRALKVLADRLSAALPGSRARVARLDGDAFAILLPEMGSAQAAGLCQGLLSTLERPVEMFGQLITISASIGIVEHPLHGRDPDTRAPRGRGDARRQTGALRSMRFTFGPGTSRRGTPDHVPRAATGHRPRRAAPALSAEAGRQLWRRARRGSAGALAASNRRLLGPDRFIPLAEQAGLSGRSRGGYSRPRCARLTPGPKWGCS